MANASAQAHAGQGSDGASTILPQEAEHFGRLAADWWDPQGSSAMLHRLNPVRLSYLRDHVDRHWPGSQGSRTPLAGKSALDVGCGAGLLCEPLARLGAAVTGIDAAGENIAVARQHAARGGLAIDYRHGGVETLDARRFDLVTSMEVIEHVSDPDAFIAGLKARLAPGGLMILSTPNRTAMSRLLLVEAAERLGMVPRGTHDWDRFMTPAELGDRLAAAGLKVIDITGISFDPVQGLHLSESTVLNYLMAVVEA
ncbi:MAG: bifunctional 2-polyprenyl-6-hydroxyphenol methylase/3-demethylubiquinol 3-O-methyltransferase UbiG [Blastomonas sp.]